MTTKPRANSRHTHRPGIAKTTPRGHNDTPAQRSRPARNGSPADETRPGISPPIHFHRRGRGEPLLLLHGIGHHWQAWEPILDRLAEKHEVIAIDLPGFGQSPVPTDGMPRGMAGTVAAIDAFLRHHGIRRPHVAGNSLGGCIALELAAAGLVTSATALAPAGFTTDWERLRALCLLRFHRASAHLPTSLVRRAMQVPSVRSMCFRMVVNQPEHVTPERAVREVLALRDGMGFEPVARAGRRYRFTGEPEVPVTVAWGTADRILAPHQAQRAREQLPLANHVTLPDCGHVPMGDAPDLVASIILETTGAQRRADSAMN